jgi:hypothetical protein
MYGYKYEKIIESCKKYAKKSKQVLNVMLK